MTVAVGLALPIVVGAGVVTWGVCTLVARRRHRPEPIRPELLTKEWGTFVRDAQRAQERYAGAWRRASGGPLRDRLSEIGRSVDAGVWECWTVAKRGDALQQSLARSRPRPRAERLATAQRDLETSPSPTKERTVASLTARVGSGERMSDLLDEAREQLHMLDARLDEIVISALELVHKSGSLGTVTAVGERGRRGGAGDADPRRRARRGRRHVDSDARQHGLTERLLHVTLHPERRHDAVEHRGLRGERRAAAR